MLVILSCTAESSVKACFALPAARRRRALSRTGSSARAANDANAEKMATTATPQKRARSFMVGFSLFLALVTAPPERFVQRRSAVQTHVIPVDSSGQRTLWAARGAIIDASVRDFEGVP